MDTEYEAELNRRLERLESPGGGGMMQRDLPWLDVLLAAGGLGVVSALLLIWTFA